MRTVTTGLIMILAGSLLGCATSAARQTYTDNAGSELVISAEQAAGQVTIYVNGQPVIEGESIYSEMGGSYQGRQLTANCEAHTEMFGSEQECDVYIDGEYAANLYFR